MRRSYLALGLASVAVLSLLLVLATLLAPSSATSLAAPLQENWNPFVVRFPHLDIITCTLATTTTDSLPNNQSFETAAILADYTGLALVVGDQGTEQNPREDYFKLSNAVIGWTYEIDAVPDGYGNYNLGMIVYDADYTPIMTDTNTFDGNSATITLVPTTSGPFYFKVFQYSDQCSGGTYHLEVNQSTPTPTPTSTPGPSPTPTPPGPTAIPGADRFEPNYDFVHAATIGTNITYDNLNFVPWGGGAEDNDFYKIWVKPGLLYTCQTSNLAPAVDPNMQVYSCPSEDCALGGNDDIEPGDYNSRFSYLSTYEGFLYILIGTGGRLPATEVEGSTYSLRCSMEVPGQSTSTPTPTRTSTPSTPSSPLPSPTPAPSGEELTVRPLTTPTPPPTPGTPSLHFVPVDLLVYYDANDDHSPGAGEGVAGILVLAYDTATGNEIARGFTDELGHLQFTAATQGLVRLSIPYLGIGHVVSEEGATVYVRIAPGSTP